MKNISVQPADGRLGVLVVGLSGAVSTTFIIGTLAARKGLAKPIGSMSQLSYLKVGKGANQREGLIKDMVPLASLDQLVFGGWDIFPDSVYDGAMHAQVLQEKDIDRESHTAYIYKDLAFDGQDPVVKDSAKTESGTRTVLLFDNVLEILPKYEDPETFIFFPDGLPRKSPYETALKRYRKETGVTATAHQMRHTFAGIMHSAEIDAKDTQAMMGHSSIIVTQDIYTEIEKQHTAKILTKANRYVMEERLREKKKCPHCGSIYLSAEDGHVFRFCPDCGNEI